MLCLETANQMNFFLICSSHTWKKIYKNSTTILMMQMHLNEDKCH